MDTIKPIPSPILPLRHATVLEYCTSVRKSRRSSYWWYFFDNAVMRLSRPFQVHDGSWWYQVKPGFCWPADILFPRTERVHGFPYRKSFIGYQYRVEGPIKNSEQVINTIDDLSGYGAGCMDAKRRNAIRKGLRECVIGPLNTIDALVVKECHAIWSDFTGRTGWKHPVSKKYIENSWSELLDLAGTTLLWGRERSTGKAAGFIIAKLIGDTAFVDTIASRTDMLHTNINDALMYSFLVSAQNIPGIKKAHYALRSYDTYLEDFKKSIGFRPTLYPLFTHLRTGISLLVKTLFPSQFQRLTGSH